jgi:hypothetical protein
MNIYYYVEEFKALWDESSKGFPDLGNEISLSEKQRREEGMEQFSQKIKGNLTSGAGKDKINEQLKGQIKEKFMIYAKNVFNFNGDEIRLISENGFSGVTKEFMKMAKKFDSNIQIEDIFQACRNMWIINSLQLLMNQPVKVTQSTFAYSMLYPYSDNYLDDPQVSKGEKIMFSHRFRDRLLGIDVIPANENESKIFNLVGMIEGDWNRIVYPEVYESLIAIHDAQTKSISLLSDQKNLSEDDLINISIEKGGTSVLADGYLINGTLTREEEWFCFGFGAFLQFIDDIQDIKEDIEGNLVTMFTNAAIDGRLEEFTNKTVTFSNYVINDMSIFKTDILEEMKGLVGKSLNYMINEAVGMNYVYFNQEYTNIFERHSPFTYTFLRKKKKQMDPNRISIMKKIEEYVFPREEVLAFS